MTVREVIEKLQQHPPTMEVMVRSVFGEFDLAPVERVHLKSVRFHDDTEGGPEAYDDCIIINEE